MDEPYSTQICLTSYTVNHHFPIVAEICLCLAALSDYYLIVKVGGDDEIVSGSFIFNNGTNSSVPKVFFDEVVPLEKKMMEKYPGEYGVGSFFEFFGLTIYFVGYLFFIFYFVKYITSDNLKSNIRNQCKLRMGCSHGNGGKRGGTHVPATSIVPVTTPQQSREDDTIKNNDLLASEEFDDKENSFKKDEDEEWDFI